MLKAIAYYLRLPTYADDRIKYMLLSCVFFIIIGSSWLLRSLKNLIFIKIAFPESLGYAPHYGLSMYPVAKFWLPFIAIPLLIIYTSVASRYNRNNLYSLIIGLYCLLFIVIACILYAHERWQSTYVSTSLLAYLGWCAFFIIETFNALSVTLFWSVTSSISSTSSAKKGYPLIIATAQVACLVASMPLLAITYCGGVYTLLVGIAILLCITIFLIKQVMHTHAPHSLSPITVAPVMPVPENVFKRLADSISLLYKHPSLLCILVIALSPEILMQLAEYRMLSLMAQHPTFASTENFAYFQGALGVLMHSASLLVALFAMHYVFKHYSMQRCLLIVPVIVLATMIAYALLLLRNKPHDFCFLWATIGIMLCISSLSWSFNTPLKEMLYLPIDEDVAFTSRSWIDTLGIKTAKQGGAHINHLLKNDFFQLISISTACSIGITVVWLYAAWYIGKKHTKLLHTHSILE